MNGIGFCMNRARMTKATDAILTDCNNFAALKENGHVIMGCVFGCITIFLTQNIGVQKFMQPSWKHLCHI